ncbi:transcriptional regulator LsrR [Anaerotignum neopropionicum]|uniref:Transcriptional regulator LsrR n=1 Tax=Anaerotignum neopropionicum TaxID=36847 RepID=A0A136WIV7_9FIRM|nr:sugar-binding transcriptional regulator [Anaerotignum neopropionicum]KXL54248.1 transcriptional regulator LsrR [Anaerotignum neopropionicum]KXL54373.1 transcriptional regulator LsrR [Anaerotignum neopropionicum]
MNMDYEHSLIIKAVWCYYIENMTQQAIADHLGISRMRVIKLLEKGREKKLIQFKIRTDAYQQTEITMQLKERYALQEIILVPSISNNINETVAHAAAMYLSDHLTDGDFVNVGFGDTMSRTLRNLELPEEARVSFVSLTGGVKHYNVPSNSEAPHAVLYIVPTPFIASTPQMACAMKEEPSVKDVLKLSSLAGYTIVGIGGVTEKATVVKEGNMTANDLLRLQAESAVGDVLGYFVDKDGNVLNGTINDRLVSTPPHVLASFPNVIAVAGGIEKAEAIAGVLKTGCINILITDEETAKAILEI